jgi:hypothetical protein
VRFEKKSFALKNALAYYNFGVVAVKSKVVRLASGSTQICSIKCLDFWK